MGRTFVDDRYELRALTGSGGMADVFLAYDRVLDRDVALKLLKDRYATDEEFVERFRREARSAAALSNRHIVPVFDRGETEDGTYYIAMEYVPGGDLGDLIEKEGPLSPEGGRDRTSGRRGFAGRPRTRHRPPRREATQHPHHEVQAR